MNLSQLAVKDYRDIVIEELVDSEALLHERVADLEDLLHVALYELHAWSVDPARQQRRSREIHADIRTLIIAALLAETDQSEAA